VSLFPSGPPDKPLLSDTEHDCAITDGRDPDIMRLRQRQHGVSALGIGGGPKIRRVAGRLVLDRGPWYGEAGLGIPNRAPDAVGGSVSRCDPGRAEADRRSGPPEGQKHEGKQQRETYCGAEKQAARFGAFVLDLLFQKALLRVRWVV